MIRWGNNACIINPINICQLVDECMNINIIVSHSMFIHVKERNCCTKKKRKLCHVFLFKSNIENARITMEGYRRQKCFHFVFRNNNYDTSNYIMISECRNL